jgi:hypothetical protein
LRTQDHSQARWQPVWLLLIAGLILLGFMVWNITVVQSRILQHAEKKYLQEQTENISDSIQKVNQESAKLALKLAGNEKLMKTFEGRDKMQLNDMLKPIFNQWKQSNGVMEITLTNQDGQVIWSSAADASFGDDMSYQRVIGKALRQKTVLSALDSNGNSDLLVTTAPVFINGEYAGLCKVSISMSYLGSKLQKSGNSQYAIFGLNGIDNTLLWSNKRVQPSLNTADIKELHDGKTISRSLDRSSGLLLIPLQDIDEITVAYIQNKFSLQEFLDAEIMNYALLLLVFFFVLLANYVCGRSRICTEDDLGNSIARISKINNVSFSIEAKQSQKNSSSEQ